VTKLTWQTRLWRDPLPHEQPYVLMMNRWWVKLGWLMVAAAALAVPVKLWLEMHGRG
jgi:hypothetical protein